MDWIGLTIERIVEAFDFGDESIDVGPFDIVDRITLGDGIKHELLQCSPRQAAAHHDRRG